MKNRLEKVPGYNELVRPVHFGQALIAGMKNGWPAKKMRVIAVTGTNGKTTTCFMIWKMLNVAGYKTGLLTTVGWGGVGGDETKVVRGAGADDASERKGWVGGDDRASEANDATYLHQQIEHMTTERVEVLNERMKAIYEAGAEFLVLETTSHALRQFRTLGVPVEVAVFTNLTHEHLDYHKTFENYRKAKVSLFRKAKAGVVNMDDPSAEWFVKAIKMREPDGADNYSSRDIITYGIEKGVLRATEVELSADGVKYTCGDMKIRTQIPGKFNVYNSLAAVGVGLKLGLEKRQIEDGIAALTAVEGRMTRVREGQKFEVIVDYAHTPDAIEKVFLSVCPERMGSEVGVEGEGEGRDDSGRKTGRIISVHGGAGRRDETTRAERGEILGRASDVVIITEDDTRDEDPEKIAEMFVEGAEKAGKVRGKDLLVELDRAKAIKKAIEMAKEGDVVLLLGKGHEKTILRADGAHEFEDIKVARGVLKGLK